MSNKKRLLQHASSNNFRQVDKTHLMLQNMKQDQFVTISLSLLIFKLDLESIGSSLGID